MAHLTALSTRFERPRDESGAKDGNITKVITMHATPLAFVVGKLTPLLLLEMPANRNTPHRLSIEEVAVQKAI